MQSYTSPQTIQHIPWWNYLDPAVHAELELPDIKTVPAQTIDVVVIGGGVAGLSAALSAQKAGARVLLLEKESILGCGATGQSTGILSAGINMPLSDLAPESPKAAFWPETARALLSLVDEATQPGTLLSAQLTGALSLAENTSAAGALEREAEARVAMGLRAEVWTSAQVAKATNGRLNTQTVVSALWLPDEGRIHPLTLLAHLAQHARAEGVILAGQAEVDTYHEIHGCATSYHWQITLTNRITIVTRGLIVAIGPTVEPNARIYAMAFAANLPDNFPVFWDASPYTYTDFRSGNGRLTVSGGLYGEARVTQFDAKYYQRLADAARHWLPELEGKEPGYTWAVDLAVAADMMPRLREIGDTARGFAIDGLGALGVLPGIVLGQRAGKLVAGRVDH